MGDAGIGKVLAVADWLPNVPGAQSEAFYRPFRARFPKPEDDYVHMRMQLLVEALAQAMEKAGSASMAWPCTAAAAIQWRKWAHAGAPSQFQQPLVVGVMERQGAPACSSTSRARVTASG